jgi:hypothetical protein
MEEYDQYGRIKVPYKSHLSHDQQHRIHQTKDLFDSSCSYCQKEEKTFAKRDSWWED